MNQEKENQKDFGKGSYLIKSMLAWQDWATECAQCANDCSTASLNTEPR